jgi:hypothetical protein
MNKSNHGTKNEETRVMMSNQQKQLSEVKT